MLLDDNHVFTTTSSQPALSALSLYESAFTSIHDHPLSLAISHPSQSTPIVMSDHPRDYDSGRLRSQFDSPTQRSKRSPPVPSPLYPPASSAFASATRPTLPPLNTTSPSRAMSSSSSHPASGFGAQSPPGRYPEPESSSSGYHHPSNATANQTRSWTEPRLDMRYQQPPNSSSGYYHGASTSSQSFLQGARSVLPPITTSFPEPHQTTSHMSHGQSSRPFMPYYPPTFRSSSYSSQHYQPPLLQAREGNYSHNVVMPPHTDETNWEHPASTSPESSRQDAPYSGPLYGFPHSRPSWNNAEMASPSSDKAPAEEQPVKKKRKRADAHQLRVLNATYHRTAFPSTQERENLAKELDMSPRSVQIWFQNKRQAARQHKLLQNIAPTLHQEYHTHHREPCPNQQSYTSMSVEASSSSRQTHSPTHEHHKHSG